MRKLTENFDAIREGWIGQVELFSFEQSCSARDGDDDGHGVSHAVPAHTAPELFVLGIAVALIFILILPLTLAVTMLGARQVQ